MRIISCLRSSSRLGLADVVARQPPQGGNNLFRRRKSQHRQHAVHRLRAPFLVERAHSPPSNPGGALSRATLRRSLLRAISSIGPPQTVCSEQLLPLRVSKIVLRLPTDPPRAQT